ncbi:MAG: hypothetical protein ABR910_06480 [Acidobacteriaceae bacterium]|jgi:hypothetical protein
MRPLSASECISPAIERTRDLLFRPFRWGTFFKLCAVAFFAEIGGGLNLNLPGRGANIHSLPPAFLAFIVAFAVILGLISLVIGLVLFYLGSRLQLVLVGLVATRQTFVGPVWRRVGQPTWRWIGLKLVYFFLAMIAGAALAIPGILYLVSKGVRLRDLPNVGSFFHLRLVEIILYSAAAFVVLLIVTAAYSLLRDFAVPSIAFEDVTISEAFRRVRYLVGTEPGPVVLFLLLRMLLVFVAAIMGEMCMAIIILLSLIPFGVAGLGLWLALHNAGAAGTAALISYALVGGLIFLCWVVCLSLAVFGTIYTFSQAYSLYFLGGRYPLLGDLLDRSTPPPAYFYPPSYLPPTQPQQPAAPPVNPSANL